MRKSGSEHADGEPEDFERELPPGSDADDTPSADARGERAGDERTGARAETEVERLRRESAENLAHWKRATADYQNLRRRLQADIDAAAQRSKQALMSDLLLVLDYLEMALKTPCATAEGKNLAAGVELTRGVLLRTLERENVRAVPDEGRFDPAVHQAVERVETDAHEDGTILATLRRGYVSNGQAIRPAQVRVAVAPTKRESVARGGESGTASGGEEN